MYSVEFLQAQLVYIIIIIIIIKAHQQLKFPWLSVTIYSYWLLLLEGSIASIRSERMNVSFANWPTRMYLNVGAHKRIVEKRKISYFVLARYLIRHRISPNQDDISHSARTFISGYQTGERPNTLSSAWDGDQHGRVSGRPCLAMPYS